jgi:ADP-ribosyl-[dinitrogen reductase] hydrolase
VRKDKGSCRRVNVLGTNSLFATVIAFEDRVVGCVLGLALGDAIGAPFEFRRAKDIPDELPVLELPWRGGPPGTTTDDTAMALNLVRSLIYRRGFDADDVAGRQVEWLLSDPPDVGTLTGRVLRLVTARLRASPGESPARVATGIAREIWEERGSEVSAGNGSVMYCPPLGAAYAARPVDDLVVAADQLSALTHHDQRCRTAVIAVCVATASLVSGADREQAVAGSLRTVQDREGAEELEFLVEAIGGSRPIDGPDQGFCLYTAGVGLQAAARGGTFDEEVVRVVRLGGDTDTNAAVAGALIGAAVGLEGLPGSWLQRMAGRSAIHEAAQELAALFG